MALEQQASTACSGLSFTRVITGLNFFVIGIKSRPSFMKEKTRQLHEDVKLLGVAHRPLVPVAAHCNRLPALVRSEPLRPMTEQQARTACSGLSFTRVINGLNFFPSVIEIYLLHDNIQTRLIHYFITALTKSMIFSSLTNPREKQGTW